MKLGGKVINKILVTLSQLCIKSIILSDMVNSMKEKNINIIHHYQKVMENSYDHFNQC